MFTGTLRFNLDPERKVSDTRIIEILSEAQLLDLINKDIKGIDQDISENGANLSSGEKQLICICRAILRVNYLQNILIYFLEKQNSHIG
jgi:ABC-type multidrug transport system fused ATPase/permease subunit